MTRDSWTGCATISEEAGVPLMGTAPKASGWLLVEHSGPWGTNGFLDSGIPEELVAEVLRTTGPAGVRVQLIRRPNTRERGLGTVVFLARSHPTESWLQAFRLPDLDALAELPIDAVTTGRRPRLGTPVRRSVFLTCTHGRRDACCALFGRQTSLAVAAEIGSAAWETTHTGGHRFAANLVALPQGLVYGRVTPEAVPDIIASHHAGRLTLSLLRGRSSFDPWTQAAEALIRIALEDDRMDRFDIDDVRTSGELVEVDVRHRGVALRAHLRLRTLGTRLPASCGDVELQDPLIYEIVELARVG